MGGTGGGAPASPLYIILINFKELYISIEIYLILKALEVYQQILKTFKACKGLQSK